MPDGKVENDLQEIRCTYCDFLMGYMAAPSGNEEIVCIYCKSEHDFFCGLGKTGYIFAGIEDDKTPWRRGLMHSRKQSIRWAYEDIMYNKDEKND